MMFNLVDYIIIAILVLSVLSGLQRGFMEALGGIAGTIIAVVAGILYYNEGAVLLEANFGLTGLLTGVIHDKFPLTAIASDSKLLGSLTILPGYSDAGSYLAYLLTLGISFILIVIVCSIIIKLGFRLVSDLINHGILGLANRILGACLVAGKNIIIIAIILGITNPIIKTGAFMGLSGALAVSQLLDQSFFAPELNNIFAVVKDILA